MNLAQPSAQVPSSASTRSLLGADGLRAIACLMVIFHHLIQQLVFNQSISAPLWLRQFADVIITGQTGVSVFFVLSGFLLSSPFWEAYLNKSPMPDLRVYAVRRAGRIMPGFYLNLLFCLVLGLLIAPQAPALIWRYFAGLTFTAGFHWLTLFPAEFNGPLWSIGFEVVSYVLMPLGMLGLFAVLGRGGRPGWGLVWWVGVWAAVVALNQLVLGIPVDSTGRGWQYGMVGGAKFWMPRYNPVGLFGHFSLGILAAGVSAVLARTKWSERKTFFDIVAAVFLIATVALLVDRAGKDDFSLSWQGPYYFPYFPALVAALLASLTRSNFMGRLFDNRFFRYTSRISFGLYLWHYLVIAMFAGAIGDLGEWLLLVVFSLATSYAIATVSWKYWEEPWLKRAQKWKPGVSATHPWQKRAGWAALAVAVLIGLPVALTTLIRPSAWDLPMAGGTYSYLTEPGPITGVATAPDGSLYVGKNGRDVYRVAPNRESKRIATIPGPWADVRLKYRRDNSYLPSEPDPFASAVRDGTYLWNLRLGPDGLLYAAAGNRIEVLTTEGQTVRSIDMPYLGEFGVIDVAFDSAGRLFASDGSAVFRLTSDFKPEECWDSGALVKLGMPAVQSAAGLAFSADGALLYLADYHGFDRDQARILEFPVIDGQLGTPKVMSAEGALYAARSPDGTVWFSSAFSGRLWRLGEGGPERVSAWYLEQGGALDFGKEGLFAACWNGAVGLVAVNGETPSFHRTITKS